MTEALFSPIEVAAPRGAQPGWRLSRLEVYNWGTFDGSIYRLDLGGDDTLLTGDIGSGKSTLVDAVTTLLLRADRINYNKAAGADTRERSLRSYVLGHYKSERTESTGSSRQVGLRDQRHYSVILGVFTNTGQDNDVTLAQVFWMRDTASTPQRFFVTAERALSIDADFSDFGTEMAGLRKRLRAQGHSVHDHFTDYGTRARRLLGIQSEQALDLFHQTISMKSVGNLTDFVRQHMLEAAPDLDRRIESLIGHFDDLTRAHEAVAAARAQLAQLDPILQQCAQHERLATRITQARAVREAVRYWLAERRAELADAELARIAADLRALGADIEALDEAVIQHRDTQRRLEVELAGAGGGRLAEIERLISIEATTRDKRKARADRYAVLAAEAGLPVADDAAGFAHSAERGQAHRAEIADQTAAVEGTIAEAHYDRRQAQADSDQLRAELQSIQGRASNIDARSLSLRSRLAVELGAREEDLPFVGELVQVGADHARWRGAAERVLRGFAMSVLVPSELYDRAAGWIDANHLGGRLVYYRVSPRIQRELPPLQEHRILADLVEVKPGPFAEWVERELSRRADHVCVEHPADLARLGKAVTVAGQVKSPGGRHEKDDRFRIDDATRWVLGWSNEDKIDALLARGSEIQTLINRLDDRLAKLTTQRAGLVGIRSALDKLAEYPSWRDLDWHSCATRITLLEAEASSIRDGDGKIAAIESQLVATNAAVSDLDRRRREASEQRGGLVSEHRRLTLEGAAARALAEELTGADGDRVRAAYGLVEKRCRRPDSLDAAAGIQSATEGELIAEIERDGERQRKLAERVAAAMTTFRRDWPAETTEMDASIEAAAEFRALAERLRGDDLPRFETEFKRLLNSNTINEIAGLQAWLHKSERLIRERIDTINESLRAIDYNPGRMITLIAQPTNHTDIRDFRDELRACTDDALAADDQYSEDRFVRVKRIIERFRGREGMTDPDRRWTSFVTDVRNWFTFAASERWRESGEEWEHYTDSDGKSGGQKEKLAYTILAASLAYQFRLEWGVTTSKDFRFAVIDEAFGRGSDVSTRYALDLFRRLGLQLLIVTPLQKVHVIEPYVAAVGFVENRTGERSRLQTMTIEDYHAARERHHQIADVAS